MGKTMHTRPKCRWCKARLVRDVAVCWRCQDVDGAWQAQRRPRAADHSKPFFLGFLVGITAMAAEADKSPAGRMLLHALEEMRQNSAEKKTRVGELEQWCSRVNGVLLVLKWMGASGVAALIWVALRSFGKVP